MLASAESETVRSDAARAAAAMTQPMLPLGQYLLTFTAIESVRLPEFSGSTWRGVLGHALRELSCITGFSQCEGCPQQLACAYGYLFLSPPPPNTERMRLYTNAPHPYLLRPSGKSGSLVRAGEQVEVELILVGHGNRFLGLFVQALALATQRGVGRGDGRLILSSVCQADPGVPPAWHEILDDGQLRPLRPTRPALVALRENVTVIIEQPLRLARHNKIVRSEELTFSDLFTNLLRRISMLQYFHTGTPLDTDFAGLVAASRKVEIINRDLHWHRWNRYSSRQNKRIAMDGIVGSFTIQGDDLAPFWPYLWLGQWVHAGKGTTMGLGHFQLAAD